MRGVSWLSIASLIGAWSDAWLVPLVSACVAVSVVAIAGAGDDCTATGSEGFGLLSTVDSRGTVVAKADSWMLLKRSSSLGSNVRSATHGRVVKFQSTRVRCE